MDNVYEVKVEFEGTATYQVRAYTADRAAEIVQDRIDDGQYNPAEDGDLNKTTIEGVEIIDI